MCVPEFIVSPRIQRIEYRCRSALYNFAFSLLLSLAQAAAAPAAGILRVI